MCWVDQDIRAQRHDKGVAAAPWQARHGYQRTRRAFYSGGQTTIASMIELFIIVTVSSMTGVVRYRRAGY